MQRKLSFFGGLLLLSMLAISAFGQGFDVQFTQNRSDIFTLDVNLEKYNVQVVEKDGQMFSELQFAGNINLSNGGWAELPYVSIPVQLSSDRNVDVEIIESSYVDISLVEPMLPSRGVIYRNQDPTDIPYQIDPESIVDDWYPEQIIEDGEPYILRKVRGQNIRVQPFRYNAVQQTLRVYTQVRIRISENTEDPINALPAALGDVNVEMAPVYRSIFVNYNQNSTRWTEEIGEFGDVLVIYTSRDATVIQPWIEWKQQKGYHVDELQVLAGTNVGSNIQSAYTANTNLLYVLLVGDWAEIKSDLGGSENTPMDPMLGCVAGGDDHHDVIIGRLSAENTTDVTAQVNKAITYERDAVNTDTWYKNALGIASSEGDGIGDDNEPDYDQISNIHDGRLLPTTYTTCHEEFDPSASASGVQSAIDGGVSVINYCGHGANTYWVSSGYSVSDASSSSNGPKYPFAFSVACVVGAFHASSDCLAEGMLRNPDGGAVATWMSTMNQPWQPPMRGQDYANDLLVQGYDYTLGSGTTTTYGRTTFGSITFNAAELMVTESGDSQDWDTYKTWTIFGDPSFQVRTDQPKEITLTNMSVSPGTYTTQVQVEGSGFEGAIVSLWQSGSQPASAMTDASGNVSINHSFNGTVKLTVTGFNLETYHADHPVAVPDPPVCDFSADQTTITVGETVQFTDNSTNYPTTWSWTFDGGSPSTSTEQNPTVTYNTPGTYDVSLYVTNNAGNDTETKVTYITVNPVTDPPVSDFVADQTTIAIGETVIFIDLSTNLPDGWEWTFEGGNPASSTDQNPSVMYDTPGTYTVSLMASNSYGSGNTETKVDYITVTLPDYCDAGSTNDGYEHISNVVLGSIDNSSAASTYTDFSTISTDANAGDDLTLTVTNTDGYATDFLMVWADWNRNGDFADANEEIWTSAQGEGPYSTTITVPAGTTVGSVRIRLRLQDDEYSPVYDACGFNTYGEVEDYTINVQSPEIPPTAEFTADQTTITEGESVQFTNLSIDNPTSFDWTFDGGSPSTSTEQNPTVTYNTPGTYDVSLYVTNNAGNDTETKVNYITVEANTDPPVSDFTADQTNVNIGASVNFTDLSTNNPTGWIWSFDGGDPSSSTDQNPSVVYNAAGVYTVEMTASNAYGNGNTETKVDYITVSAVGFSMDFEDCADYSSDFTPWTVLDEDVLATFESSDCVFPGEGDPFGFMAFNPVDAGFSLAAPHGGDRVGMAICPDDGSASDDWLISNQLSLGDNSSFSLWVLSPKPGTWGNDDYEVLVSITGNAPADFIVISGGTPVEAPDTWTQHTYDLSGYDNQDIYLAVRHTSADKFMLWIDDMEINTDFALPYSADFVADLTTVEIGQSVTFTDLSSGTPTSWNWNFGDSGSSTDQNPVHTYASVGTYTVELISSDGVDSDNEIEVDYITVTEPAPIASFTANPTTSCDGIVQFTDASTGASSWEWDFDDGNTSTEQNPEHTYAADGVYTVTLTVTNTGGVDTHTETISVEIPDATIDPIGPFCVTADALTLSAATSGGTWSGDGVSGTSFDPTIAGDGDHVITYEVTIGTCTDTNQITVHVDDMPDATINPVADLCENEAPITLTAATPGGIWVGTGVSGDQFDPSNGEGDYTVYYDVINGECAASAETTIHVDALPDATIDPIGPFCTGDASVALTAATTGGTWTGDGVSGNTFDPVVAGIGTHTITYSIDNGVCAANNQIEVLVADSYDASIDAVDPLCENADPITLTAATAGGDWSGSGVSGNQFDPSVAGAGDHLISYTVGTGSCEDSDNALISVQALPNVEITSPTAICLSEISMILTADIAGGIWSGAGVSGDVFNAETAGIGVHIVTYEVTEGVCTVMETIDISVGEAPTVNVDVTNASASTVSDGSATANVSGGLVPYTYAWSNGDGDATMEDVIAGDYTLTVTDAAGCETVVNDIVIDFTNSIAEESIAYAVYPNPAQNEVYIELDNLNANSIDLVNILGQSMLTRTVEGDVTRIDVSGFVSGVYFIRINANDKQYIEKLMID